MNDQAHNSVSNITIEPIPNTVLSTHSKPIPDTVPSAAPIPDQVPWNELDTNYEPIPEEVSQSYASNLNSMAAPPFDTKEPSLACLLMKGLENM